VEKEATQALKKATDAYTKVEQLVRKAEAKKEQVETQRATIKRSMDGMGADLERVRTKLDSMASVAA
jgi:phage shock protein A